MAFGIIRARNLSAGKITSTDKHNSRRYSSAEEYPENIQINGEENTVFFSQKHQEAVPSSEMNLEQALDDRLQLNNVKGIRKNSNLAIEYVVTINDKKAWEHYSFGGYVNDTKTWLEQRHGKESVIAQSIHKDESNPHVHFIVVPLKTKEVKWKNQKGEGVRTETRLNTREFTGGRKKLRKLQDDYFKHLIERYKAGNKETSKLGVPIYRGTLVENQTKEYIKQTDLEIARLREEIENAETEAEKFEKMAQESKKYAEKTRLIIEMDKIEERKRLKNWMGKGTRDNKTIFHDDEDHQKKKKGPKI